MLVVMQKLSTAAQLSRYAAETIQKDSKLLNLVVEAR
jgi:hypothetical protein